MSKPKVKFASSEKIKEYKKEIDLIYTILGIPLDEPSFTSDYTTLSMIVGSHFNHNVIERKYKKYILTRLFMGLGFILDDKDYNETLINLCEKIRKNNITKTKFIPYYFLGIKSIKTKDDFLSIPWICALVEQNQYQKGYSMTIDNPKFAKEVAEDEKHIMNQTSIIVEFVDGNKFFLNSIYDAYCYIIARANNYQADDSQS